MKSTIIYKKWEVILVPFPFTDLQRTKKRPALIISPNEYNESLDVVIAMITSQLYTKPRIGDYKIQDWQNASLPKPSLIRMKFATITKSIIDKKIGSLTEIDIRVFKKSLLNFFEN